MGISKRLAAITLLTLAACGGGGAKGNSSFGGSTGSTLGVVELLSHSPVDGAVQVPTDVVMQLQFDASMATGSFQFADTWLREAATQDEIALSFAASSNGRVDVRPEAPLRPGTEYTFQLAALTADVHGRILDRTTTISFWTVDETAPTLIDFDVPPNATGVSRHGPFTLTFDEPVAAASLKDQSIYIRDVFGEVYTCCATAVGDDVLVTPFADLPGDRPFFVVVTTNVTDRAGNALDAPFESTFMTESDADAPSAVASWPPNFATGVSPRVEPAFTFDESMDPASVENSSLLFVDQFGVSVPFMVAATLDKRQLRICPVTALSPNRSYTLSFILGAAAASDVSGNLLAQTQELVFTTGSDDRAPAVLTSSPEYAQARVPSALIAEVTFDEPIDATWVTNETVQLLVEGQPWSALVDVAGEDTIRVTPIDELPLETACALFVRGGQEGVRDVAGNVIADTNIAFTTSSDAEQPDAVILPPHQATGVAVSSQLSVVFDAPMEPATLNANTIQFTNDAGAPLAGSIAISGGDRVVTFTPSAALAGDAYYRVRIRGGNAGPRRQTGNWFEQDRESRFRTTAYVDSIPPSVTISVNGIPEVRRHGLALPPYGWDRDVRATDALGQWVDAGSVEVVLSGGDGPDPDALRAAVEVTATGVNICVPEAASLPPGDWSVQVKISDLSGNVGQSNIIDFRVDAPTSGALPFERTQVVWVRTDLDRANNGSADFDDDMLRLGLATAGDPNGSNAWLRQVLLDGILAKTNSLYQRSPGGEPLDAGSVPIRFTHLEPISVAHTQIAVGGLDPEGDANRSYGDNSSGVLGRAFYDYRNSNVSERNTSNSPGTGVFPAEMFLYQARIHYQMNGAFQTAFSSRFQPLCPEMGGTPAGAHPLDADVLQADFDYENATGSQRARWNTVMAAMDDWAAVIGVILAHECGHSCGLVAPGDMPFGLFGDSSLHNSYAGAAEVMAASVGYEAMTSLNYKFRDINLAYLRQRILLR
ncbi:MAG: Ig-like domain-containing protein [Planctomycetota bacterium]|nr:Ig-like domain-containing protein [Planctomycetota bacterium]